jgi:RNA 2',3'-cyclic 3'-phosphodiesterase
LAQAINHEVNHSGIVTDFKPFIPHITLARHGSAFVDHDCEPIIFRADSFCLVESSGSPDGVVYKVKDSWPLIKKGQ